MDFKELLDKHKFFLTLACLTHRIYDNGSYILKVTNINGIVQVSHKQKPEQTIYRFNINSKHKHTLLKYK